MNYAIQELTNWSRNFGRCEILKDCSNTYKEAAEALKENKFIPVSDDIIKDLNDTRYRVLDGLKTWGSDHQDAKKRQLKKAEDLKEAILFLKPDYKL